MPKDAKPKAGFRAGIRKTFRFGASSEPPSPHPAPTSPGKPTRKPSGGPDPALRSASQRQTQPQAAPPAQGENDTSEVTAPLWVNAVRALLSEAKDKKDASFGLREEDFKNAESYLNASGRHPQLKITSNNAYVERIKTMVPPILAGVKPIVMAVAALDPHKIAPFVVASAFFLVEFGINNMPPDERLAIEEFFSATDGIILRWVQCEMYGILRRRHLADTATSTLRAKIPETYIMALRLQSKIRKACRSTKSIKKALMLQEKKTWDLDLRELKLHDEDCQRELSRIGIALEFEKSYADILHYIKPGNDPELSHFDLREERRLTEKAFVDTGRWFIDGHVSALANLGADEPDLETHFPIHAKPVLWLRSPPGMGKTVLMSQAVHYLRNRVTIHGADSIRIAHYYCNASAINRALEPKFAIIIRSLCLKLAITPDGNPTGSRAIEKTVHRFYNDICSHGQKKSDEISEAEWKTLLVELVRVPKRMTVIAIDALDECTRDDTDTLLNFLVLMLDSVPKLRLVLSSREHIYVAGYFGQYRVKQVRPDEKTTKIDLLNFIDCRLAKLRNGAATKKSEYFKGENTDLLKRLREVLISRANGMFKWVEIWLSILFPSSEQFQVRGRTTAAGKITSIGMSSSGSGDQLAQLKDIYEWLWENNSKVQVRAGFLSFFFHLILSARVPLTWQELHEAWLVSLDENFIRAQQDDYETMQYITANFLTVNTSNHFVWSHESAKNYVEQRTNSDGAIEFSHERNNDFMLNLCFKLMEDRHHAAWKDAGLDFGGNTQLSYSTGLLKGRENGPNDGFYDNPTDEDLVERIADTGIGDDDSLSRWRDDPRYGGGYSRVGTTVRDTTSPHEVKASCQDSSPGNDITDSDEEYAGPSGPSRGTYYRPIPRVPPVRDDSTGSDTTDSERVDTGPSQLRRRTHRRPTHRGGPDSDDVIVTSRRHPGGGNYRLRTRSIVRGENMTGQVSDEYENGSTQSEDYVEVHTRADNARPVNYEAVTTRHRPVYSRSGPPPVESLQSWRPREREAENSDDAQQMFPLYVAVYFSTHLAYAAHLTAARRQHQERLLSALSCDASAIRDVLYVLAALSGFAQSALGLHARVLKRLRDYDIPWHYMFENARRALLKRLFSTQLTLSPNFEMRLWCFTGLGSYDEWQQLSPKYLEEEGDVPDKTKLFDQWPMWPISPDEPLIWVNQGSVRNLATSVTRQVYFVLDGEQKSCGTNRSLHRDVGQGSLPIHSLFSWIHDTLVREFLQIILQRDPLKHVQWDCRVQCQPLDAGGSIAANMLYVKDRDGNLPIHHAAKRGDPGILNILLKAEQNLRQGRGASACNSCKEPACPPRSPQLFEGGKLTQGDFFHLTMGDTPLVPGGLLTIDILLDKIDKGSRKTQECLFAVLDAEDQYRKIVQLTTATTTSSRSTSSMGRRTLKKRSELLARRGFWNLTPEELCECCIEACGQVRRTYSGSDPSYMYKWLDEYHFALEKMLKKMRDEYEKEPPSVAEPQAEEVGRGRAQAVAIYRRILMNVVPIDF